MTPTVNHLSPSRLIARTYPTLLAILLSSLLSSACGGPIAKDSEISEGGAKASDDESRRNHLFFPPAPDKPRIQYLTKFGSDLDLYGEQSWISQLIFGKREMEYALPRTYGIAIGDDRIFVCAFKAGFVYVFNLVDREMEFIGLEAEGRMQTPTNIALGPDMKRYVADTGQRKIMVYDRDNRYVRSYTGPEGWRPADVKVRGDRMYVTDSGNEQILIMDLEGNVIDRFGQPGGGLTDFLHLSNLDLDQEGNVFVMDSGHFRIAKFSPELEYLQTIGGIGKSIGKFSRPRGLALDREGRVWAVDAAFGNVQIFAPDGMIRMYFSQMGFNPGYLYLPAQIVIDYDHVQLFEEYVAPGHEIEFLILVTNQHGNNKVTVYGFLKQDEEEAE